MNSRWFFKRGTSGYEVWEKALLYGPGFPRKYRLMIIPFNISSVMWKEKIARLKWMDWVRRKNQQSEVVDGMIQKYDEAQALKKQNIVYRSKEFFHDAKKKFREAAENAGINETQIRLRMKGVVMG